MSWRLRRVLSNCSSFTVTIGTDLLGRDETHWVIDMGGPNLAGGGLGIGEIPA